MSEIPPRAPRVPASPALAVDFGEVRIGLAISDDHGCLALPLDTLARETDRRAVYRIASLARIRKVQSLVVGEPRHVDGHPSPNQARIRRFAAKLVKATSLPLFWVEETLSTAEADARLRAVESPATKRRSPRHRDTRRGDPRRDMIAAQIILEDALAGAARAESENNNEVPA